MPALRDPLSLAFDDVNRPVLIQAIRRHRNHQRGPIVWVASPRSEFRKLDRGGLTKTERAFVRSLYYFVFKVPRNQGVAPFYSLPHPGPIGPGQPSSHGRLARPFRVSLTKYGHRGPGGGKVRRVGDPWTDFHSEPGRRIDS